MQYVRPAEITTSAGVGATTTEPGWACTVQQSRTGGGRHIGRETQSGGASAEEHQQTKKGEREGWNGIVTSALASANALDLEASRFQITSLRPALARFVAIPAPIMPSPMKPGGERHMAEGRRRCQEGVSAGGILYSPAHPLPPNFAETTSSGRPGRAGQASRMAEAGGRADRMAEAEGGLRDYRYCPTC
ncbi:hypothetical protein T492DRAFT_836990 [Pavlovales sp. CCMP2436]|nr:hypothetical protein T492DRAFT_836990 [Pavlovales sp. CCMP2436]